MNIFDQYLDKIKKIILVLSKKSDLILPDKLDGITAEIPPSKFDSDISTNLAMVLSKINKRSPIDLANILSEEIKKNDEMINEISVVKPGFINIKFKPIFWTHFVEEIIKNSKSFGINTKEKKKKII
jgi:arginyl-tRNA synthetase